jgi:hypothetical protein
VLTLYIEKYWQSLEGWAGRAPRFVLLIDSAAMASGCRWHFVIGVGFSEPWPESRYASIRNLTSIVRRFACPDRGRASGHVDSARARAAGGIAMPRLWGGLPDDYDMCSRCVGSGKVASGLRDIKCPRCDGLGRVRKRRPHVSAGATGDDSSSAPLGPEKQLTKADTAAMYDRALAEAVAAKADAIAKLDGIHAELRPARFGLLPHIEDNPELDARYATMRAENRRLRGWLHGLDPLDPATAQALRQLLEGRQGRDDSLFASLERFRFACEGIDLYRSQRSWRTLQQSFIVYAAAGFLDGSGVWKRC